MSTGEDEEKREPLYTVFHSPCVNEKWFSGLKVV
jgi:hypothetical protein